MSRRVYISSGTELVLVPGQPWPLHTIVGRCNAHHHQRHLKQTSLLLKVPCNLLATVEARWLGAHLGMLLLVTLATGLAGSWRPRLGQQERVAVHWRQDDSPLARRLSDMISVTPSLQAPIVWRPTPWARASKAQFALATVRSRLGAVRRSMEPPLTGRTTTCDDPDVTVEWTKDPVGYALPADAPIVIFLHTITGSAAQTRCLMKYASMRGWRSCTFVRRGHGGPLQSPSFNLLGSVEDVEQQLDAVRRAYPRAKFVAMAGVSAGSAQLISYLGRAGEATPVSAACAVCPAWDVRTAFSQIGAKQPVAERAMVASVKAKFLTGKNEKVLREWDAAAFDRCVAATSLPELIEAHAPFAMRDADATGESYYEAQCVPTPARNPRPCVYRQTFSHPHAACSLPPALAATRWPTGKALRCPRC